MKKLRSISSIVLTACLAFCLCGCVSHTPTIQASSEESTTYSSKSSKSSSASSSKKTKEQEAYDKTLNEKEKKLYDSLYGNPYSSKGNPYTRKHQ